MKVGTAPILHHITQLEPQYVHAFSESCLLFSSALSTQPFRPFGIWQCQTNALRIESSKNHGETEWFGICQTGIQMERSHWRSSLWEDPGKSGNGGCLVRDKMPWKCQSAGLASQRSSPTKTFFSDSNVCEQCQSYMVNKFIHNIMRLKHTQWKVGQRHLWYVELTCYIYGAFAFIVILGAPTALKWI